MKKRKLLALALAGVLGFGGLVSGLVSCQAPDPMSVHPSTSGSGGSGAVDPSGSSDPSGSVDPSGVVDPSEGTTPEVTGTTLAGGTDESLPASESESEPEPGETTDDLTGETSEEQAAETTPEATDLPAVQANEPPLSDLKEPAYFQDALFIGDSRTQGLMLYGTLYDAEFIYNKGYNVGQYFDTPASTGAGQMTGASFIRQHAGLYKDVYIGFGINETGWPLGNFIEYYRRVVQDIKANQSNAAIYVMSVLPVEASQDSHAYINNRVIREVNRAVAQMTLEEDVYFLDATPAVAGPDGAIPAGATPDGIHFDRDYVMKWQEYIQTHVAPR